MSDCILCVSKMRLCVVTYMHVSLLAMRASAYTTLTVTLNPSNLYFWTPPSTLLFLSLLLSDQYTATNHIFSFTPQSRSPPSLSPSLFSSFLPSHFASHSFFSIPGNYSLSFSGSEGTRSAPMPREVRTLPALPCG